MENAADTRFHHRIFAVQTRGEEIMKNTYRIWQRLMSIVLVLMMSVSLLTEAGGAEVNFAYPKASSKKGLYVCPGMEEDAIELGIKHATINLSVGDFMPSSAYRNKLHCIAFEYEGETFWFAKNAVEKYDTELQRLSENNVLVTAILLLPKREDDLKYLIYPDARNRDANYYQWNMTNASAVKMLRAIVTFFQRRYSNSSGPRIVGWIVGNEVNNSKVWNWAGEISIDKYMELYASQVAEVISAAKAVYANARVYMCLDHYWTASNGSYWYAGKTILKKFASCMKARGLTGGSWCIAYHPYNISQYEPNIMSSSDAVTNKSSTRIITMKNLKVLTKFVKKKYSKKCRIILSEQGYSSITAGSDTAKEQARNVALAYYIAEQNSMVDAFILHRQVNHTGEGERYGLYTSWGGENAAYQKASWLAYKYADTTKKNKYTKYAAKKAKTLSGKKVKKKVTAKAGKLQATSSLAWNMGYTSNFQPFGALSNFELADGVYTLTHDYSRNPNVPWGMTRTGTINCNQDKNFGFGISVSSSVSGSAIVYVRLWSGTKKYIDSSCTIPCGVQNSLAINLNKWKYRKKITRIDIYIRPKTGGWSKGTTAQIFSIGARP